MTEVPEDLHGPGRIRQRQTTFWKLQSRSGGSYRVNFEGKVEFAFAGEHYPDVHVLGEHPLLLDFHEPMQQLFILGKSSDAAELVARIDSRVRMATDGWRTLERYCEMDPQTLLEGGHGLFVRAPTSLCSEIAPLLTEAGLKVSLLDGPSCGANLRLLLLGQSYVIARSFDFRPLCE
jgi:hypothetical protein